MRFLRVLGLAVTVALLGAAPASAQNQPKVLVLTKTTGTPHASMDAGYTAIQEIGQANNLAVERSTDASQFTEEKLAQYAAVVFLSTNGDVLTTEQESAFQSYIRDGGGFLGIHDAARLETGSSWFTQLVGARPNAGSPTATQTATVEVQDQAHVAGKGLPTEWQVNDEWFNWAPNPAGNVHVIANLRERSYNDKGTGANGWEHPISWCRDYDGGRSFYTGIGHTAAVFATADFRKHLLGALRWTTGTYRGNCKATIDASYTAERLTQPNNFTGVTPESQLNQIGEPHGLDIDSKGRVFYIGRAAKGSLPPTASWSAPDGWRGWGTVHVYDPGKAAGQRVHLAGTLDVFGDSGGGDELTKKEEGLIGIALDPNFDTNKYVYLHYTPYTKVDFVRHIGTRRVARFTFDEATGRLDLSSEKPIIEWQYQNHSCCHMGGDMDFDKDGNLYVLTGDTNSSGSTGGYSGNFAPPQFPANDPNGIGFNDARRTAGNTNDLNGKILRIKPKANPQGAPGIGTTYDIPDGNLFTGNETESGKTGPLTRREIYVMGVRNPTRLWIDKETGWVMTGWVGPDATNPSADDGPARYENLAAIPKAGNYGWPFCTGNNQPYRDRDNAGNKTGWYNCDALKNESKWNTGLTNLPPATPTNMWYASGGGGPVFPATADGTRPNYGATPTYSQPYLAGGGGQATMPGPFYRYDESLNSSTKFPEFWDQKWFFDDNNRAATARAVGLDADTVNNHKPPKTAVDITGIIGKTSAQAMGMKFGPDGNLYVLDYGGGFFTTTARQSLWKISYTGGPSTPSSAPRATPIGAYKVQFSKGSSGGVSYVWDFGDGTTSTEANPTHTYAEAKRYNAKLTVTYADGSTSAADVAVDVLALADEAAPTTTHTLSPAAPSADGTYKKPVTVTLNATDTGGSGVDRIEYRVNGGAWSRYSAPVTRQQPGVYTIDYRSRDRAGNLETFKSVRFEITVIMNCPTNLNDEFNGPDLDPKWQILRSTPAARSFVDGQLRLKIENGDMIGATATARNVLTQAAPAGSWVISTKLNVSELTNEGEQAGLLLWQSEGNNTNNFVKIVYINKGATRRFEYVSTRNSGQDVQNSPEFTEFPTEVYMRVSSNGSNRIIAEGSFDGETWSPIGAPIVPSPSTQPMRFGIKASDTAASNNGALFDYFRVDCSDRVPPQTQAMTNPSSPDGQLAWYKNEPTVSLTADEPVSSMRYRVDGGEWSDYGQPFKVAGQGNHTVEYFSVDKADEPNTETVKTMVLRTDSAAPQTEISLGGDMRAGGSVDVKLDAVDGDLGSGPVLTQYRVDGGPWTAYSAKDEQIFDGTQASLAQWRQAPSGEFRLMEDGSGGITPVGGLGMLWYPVKQYGDFRVKVQFREGRTDGGSSNGGVFLRFPDPRVPTAQRPDACARTGSAATQEAWVAIYCGHEFQLFDGVEPNSEPQKTGSVYNFDPNTINQIGTPKPKGEWEDYEIEARGQTFKIYRNGALINEFVNSPGKASSRSGDPDTSQRQIMRGYIGLQNHGGADTTQYRNVRVQDLTPGAATANPTGLFTVEGDGQHTVEFRSIDAAGNVEERKSRTFEIGGLAAPTTNTTPLPSPPTSTILPAFIDTPASYRLGTLPSRISRAGFARRGLSVPVTCTGAMTGSAKLTLSKSDARKLRISRRTLDASDVRCWGPHTVKVTLKPSKALARQLARKGGPRNVKLTLAVQMRDWGKPATTETRTITLKRR